jgi:hypothetical protein
MKNNAIKLIAFAIGWLCLFHVPQARADFNKTYRLSGKRLLGTSTAILNENSTRDLVICNSVLDSPINTGTNISLLKLDSNGNIITGVLQSGNQGIGRVIETRDSGVLLVCDFDDHLQVTKFNNTLSVVWAVDLPHISTYGFIATTNGFTWDIDIEKCVEMDQEQYYIVHGVRNANYSQDIDISVLKVSENGTVAWHRQYYDANRSSFGGSWSAIRHYTNGITSYPDPQDASQKYFVVGGHYWSEDDNAAQTTNLFCLTIDAGGNIVKQYQDIDAKSLAQAADIIWDGDSLLMTYVAEGGTSNPTVASGLGLIKFDNSFNSFRGKVFYQECENYGLSISIPSDGNYLIGGWVSACYTPATWASTPLLLKVDRNSLGELFYQRYNTSDAVLTTGYHRTDNLDASYLLGESPGTLGLGDLRLIKTTASGNACGAEEFDMIVEDFTPTSVEQEYTYDDLLETQIPEPSWYNVTYTVKNCSDGSVHKTSNGTSPGHADAMVFPTTVQSGRDNKLQCNVNMDKEGLLAIQITNTLGQVVYRTEYKASQGSNNIAIDTRVLAEGLNIVHITRDKELIKTAKIVVTH